VSEVAEQRIGGIAVLAFSQPQRRNTISDAQVEATTAALETLSADADVKVVVLTGSDTVFHVGGDMNVAADDSHRRSVEAYQQQLRKVGRVVTLLHTMPQPTIAAINGGCAGAGFGFALACDLRYACPEARFNSAFLQVGLPGELAAIWFATRIVGGGRARELFFLPEKFDAGRALQAGLINGVFQRETLLEQVVERATRMASAAPLALRAMKANFLDAERMSFADYLPAEGERMARVGCSVDAAEGRLAFRERRVPRYEGR
jgi:2-(1,2-epoxy-1,2-dihydrophenyl)acetyl-CoA isomerase